ncbi:MAG: hypothetical protein KIT83_17490 [Bryobacterales bacterium]|nr:hypothetical protein [Bryobacterales bacterium]
MTENRRQHRQALAAGGDASVWQRFLARFHKRDEDATVEREFRRIREELGNFQELPPYFAWEPLASEMKANILLGVEAGEAVRPRRLHPPIGWRAGLAMAALSVLMISGYWWQMPHRRMQPPSLEQAVLEAAPGRLSVEQQEGGFALMFQEQGSNPLLSGASGSLRADFVDIETGQLTVAHVYLD